MKLRKLAFAAALLVGGAARPQEHRPPPLPVFEQPPLSQEDAELVKELALLERLDLVRNLDLFDQNDEAPPQEQPQRQP